MATFSNGQREVEVKIFGKTSLIPIPYAFTQVLENSRIGFVGVLYLDVDSSDNSFVDGTFIGSIVGSYHLDRSNTEYSRSNTVLTAYIRINFNEKKLYGRLSARDISGGERFEDWQEFLAW